ncbi:MAG: hypothetical protein LBB17_03695 [Puniceicoccales bacterium]|jgi:hypothetical protein|nr:hypothetical protein [Puniceicoccales bacterium]
MTAIFPRHVFHFNIKCEILFAICDNFHNIVIPMEVKSENRSENIDPAAKVASANPADTKNKSSFAGRTFGMGTGNKTFMTKEVMSAVDKKVDATDPTSKQEENPTAEK